LAGWTSYAVLNVKKGGVEVMCGGYGRRFLTKEEKIEWLQEYKTNLEQELKGVTERIQELKH
jgi:hypothetical protein